MRRCVAALPLAFWGGKTYIAAHRSRGERISPAPVDLHSLRHPHLCLFAGGRADRGFRPSAASLAGHPGRWLLPGEASHSAVGPRPTSSACRSRPRWWPSRGGPPPRPCNRRWPNWKSTSARSTPMWMKRPDEITPRDSPVFKPGNWVMPCRRLAWPRCPAALVPRPPGVAGGVEESIVGRWIAAGHLALPDSAVIQALSRVPA